MNERDEPQGEVSHEDAVDTSLIDAMLALSPEERLRHNDRMLRTIALLRTPGCPQSFSCQSG